MAAIDEQPWADCHLQIAKHYETEAERRKWEAALQGVKI